MGISSGAIKRFGGSRVSKPTLTMSSTKPSASPRVTAKRPQQARRQRRRYRCHAGSRATSHTFEFSSTPVTLVRVQFRSAFPDSAQEPAFRYPLPPDLHDKCGHGTENYIIVGRTSDDDVFSSFSRCKHLPSQSRHRISLALVSPLRRPKLLTTLSVNRNCDPIAPATLQTFRQARRRCPRTFSPGAAMP